MPQANLTRRETSYDSGRDSIVVINDIVDIPGGRTLDVSGVVSTRIEAGHIVIRSSDGTYKPMPVNGSAYEALPSDHTYAGVLKFTIRTECPQAAILTMGQVREAALPFAVNATIKAALPRIEFI